MSYSKSDAIKIITSCADKYHTELEGNTLLFICMDKHKNISYIEFSFFDYNFLHLTGLKVNKGFLISSSPALSSEDDNDKITAVRFYKRCLDRKIALNDFEFSDSGTTPLKLDVLPFIISKNLSANMVGNFSSAHPKLYTEKVAGGIKAYMGFVQDASSLKYVPNTVVKEDIRKNILICLYHSHKRSLSSGLFGFVFPAEIINSRRQIGGCLFLS